MYINIAAYLGIESLWKKKEETNKCGGEDIWGLEIKTGSDLLRSAWS